MTEKKKKPRDVNVLAKELVGEATDEEQEESNTLDEREDSENPKVKSGRKGGLKGGAARAQKLSAEERREIARKAALARWRRSE